MTRGSKKRRIERLKSALIVLLSCSAVFLLMRTQAAIVSSEDSGTAYQTGAEGSASTESPGATARPLRMAAAIQRGSEVVRYGVQYDQESADALYQQSYSLLVEALSSASQLRAVNEDEFQQALSTAPGLYFDWQGEIPVEVLNGWLSVDSRALTGTVRRMVLTAVEGQVLLYYWDESAGHGWVCTADVISAGRLTESVGALQENGVLFAFESEDFGTLAPYTMLQPQMPVPVVYNASNPITSQESRQTLQEQLGFPENSVSYPAAGEQVIRSRNDTLHIVDNGLVTYEAAEEGSDRYRLSGTGVYEAVEGCRRLAQQTLGQTSGEAALYLISAEETGEDVWEIEFGYSLNGTQVRIGEEGWAARFVVERGQVTDFQMWFRSYTDSGTTSVVLPVRQAMAAMEAKGHEGEELLLVYLDSGGEGLVSASWAAARALDTGR